VVPVILAISGSLRSGSINTAALRAAAAVAAQDGNVVEIYASVRELPHFDPDLEGAPPDAVLRLRASCEQAAAVLLAVPEYAFGIPGAFKNALDWMVGSGSLYRKPITLLNVAPPGRGAHVRSALRDVLNALDAQVSHSSVPVSQQSRGVDGEIRDAATLVRLRTIVGELVQRAHATRRMDAQSLIHLCRR
jgi:NAD(P)H-dependent FMN reductase